MREGSTIGQYRVLRKIGEGGMGMVFVGEHLLIGRRAAIKVLKPALSADKDIIDRFFNEARATTAIRDPGIPQLFDFGIAPDRSAFIVMELLDGESVAARIKRLGALPPDQALLITRQVAGTLAVAHAAGIVHRDLKPANLFVVADAEAPGGERVKILDFGVAKLGPDLHDGNETRTGAVIGTPVFMSPEQCSAEPVDARSDIYSLGCVTFSLLVGRPPFVARGAGSVISAHLKERPPTPSSLVPQLPPEIDELVLRCLAKSPDDRYPSMQELQRECDRLLASGLPARASAPSVFGPPTIPLDREGHDATTLGAAVGQSVPPISRRVWRPVAAVAVLGLAVLLAVMVGRGGDQIDVDRASPAAAVAPSRLAAEPPVDAMVRVAPDAELARAPVVEPVGEAAPAGAAKPAMPKPVAKPKPRAKATSSTDDLYDDRN